MLSRFDALADQVGRLLDVDEAIIDGEVIAVNESGRPQFYELLRVPRSASYVAFDILWADGTDLRSSPLSDRRKRLQAILPEGSPIVSEALSVAGRGRELFELMREHDLEGIVAKRLDDPYDPRFRWLKIKNPDYSQKGGKGRPVQQVMAAARAFGSPISESDTGAPMRVVQGLPVPSRAQSRRDGRTLWRGDDRDRLALQAGLRACVS